MASTLPAASAGWSPSDKRYHINNFCLSLHTRPKFLASSLQCRSITAGRSQARSARQIHRSNQRSIRLSSQLREVLNPDLAGIGQGSGTVQLQMPEWASRTRVEQTSIRSIAELGLKRALLLYFPIATGSRQRTRVPNLAANKFSSCLKTRRSWPEIRGWPRAQAGVGLRFQPRDKKGRSAPGWEYHSLRLLSTEPDWK